MTAHLPVEWSGSMLIPGPVSTGELGLPPIDCKGKVSYPLLNISIDSHDKVLLSNSMQNDL